MRPMFICLMCVTPFFPPGINVAERSCRAHVFFICSVGEKSDTGGDSSICAEWMMAISGAPSVLIFCLWLLVELWLREEPESPSSHLRLDSYSTVSASAFHANYPRVSLPLYKGHSDL